MSSDTGSRRRFIARIVPLVQSIVQRDRGPAFTPSCFADSSLSEA
jgi:hypothetical protein